LSADQPSLESEQVVGQQQQWAVEQLEELAVVEELTQSFRKSIIKDFIMEMDERYC